MNQLLLWFCVFHLFLFVCNMHVYDVLIGWIEKNHLTCLCLAWPNGPIKNYVYVDSTSTLLRLMKIEPIHELSCLNTSIQLNSGKCRCIGFPVHIDIQSMPKLCWITLRNWEWAQNVRRFYVICELTKNYKDLLKFFERTHFHVAL